MQAYGKEAQPLEETYLLVVQLFEPAAPDLIEGFQRFLPNTTLHFLRSQGKVPTE